MTPTYDPANIFAKILRGEAPCVKVYEDDVSLAFMDVMPRADGHTLVIPKVPLGPFWTSTLMISRVSCRRCRRSGAGSWPA